MMTDAPFQHPKLTPEEKALVPYRITQWSGAASSIEIVEPKGWEQQPPPTRLISRTRPNDGMAVGRGGVAYVGAPIDPESAPKKIRYKRAKNKPGQDYNNCYIVTVSERMRALIDDLERGVHQFVPIEVVKGRTQEHFETRYLLVVCKRLHCIDLERTPMEYRLGDDWDRRYYPWGPPLQSLPQDYQGNFIWSPAKPHPIYDFTRLRGHHLWLDPTGAGGPSAGWVSQEFVKRARAVKLIGPVFKRLEFGET